MDTTAKPTSRKIIASVQRAIDIINLFNYERGELGNAEIAKIVELPIGTVSGLIYTLKINGYLDQNPSNKKYRLGLKLAERASVLFDQLDLRREAAPYLEELRDWCGESVNLAIRDGNEVVYIERMFGNHALGIRSELGRRGPLHSTALGKVIFSFLPKAEQSALMERYQFTPVTTHTITNKDRFEKELKVVHDQGFALDEQENELGGRCVGAPIFDRFGYPIAAISISVPIQRFPVKEISRFSEKLIMSAKAISRKMGHIVDIP